MRLCAVLLFLAIPCTAANYYFTKQVNVAVLKRELSTSGIQFAEISGIGDNHVIVNPSKDPAAVVKAHVYADPFTTKAENKAAAMALAQKLKAGTITQGEKDELFTLLVFLYLGPQ